VVIPDTVFQFAIDGIVYGSLIAVGAMALTLVFGVMEFINFAHGEYMTLGAYVAFVFNVGLQLPIWAAFLLTLPVMAVFSVGVDRIVFRPIRDQNHIAILIASIGLSFVLRNLIRIVWGVTRVSFKTPFFAGYTLGPVTITPQMIGIFLTAVGLMAIVHYLFTRTMIGRVMRAISDNQNLASASGIHVERIVVWAWALGGALAGGAGVLIGLQNVIGPMMGFNVLLAIFGAVVLGGIGNVYGALVGGLIVGLLQKISVAFLPSAYQITVVFVILAVFFVYKPDGLFKSTTSI
jgi:branched-subunit amino acid ABC-type transport system permease component